MHVSHVTAASLNNWADEKHISYNLRDIDLEFLSVNGGRGFCELLCVRHITPVVG